MGGADLDPRYESTPLGGGTAVHVLSASKWKSISVDVFLRRSLDHDAAAFAILPSVLKRGTTKVPDLRAMTRRLDELYGATLRSDILKVGEAQILLVRLEVANPKYVPGAPRLLEDGLDLLRDLLLDPRLEDGAFPAPIVEQEKRNHARFIEGLLNDKSAYASERCCEEMCRGEPFGLYEYGSVEGVRALEPRALTAFYRAQVDRCPLDVFVSGDLEPARARALVSDRFSGARRGDLEARVATPHPPPGPVREVVEERPLKQGKLVLGLRSEVTARDPAFPALLFANGILGGFPHSKLFRVVREREGLCYYASSSLEKTKGILVIASGIEPKNYERARALIEAQVEALQRGEVSDEEMEKTRKALIRNFETVPDSASRLATHWYTGLLNGRAEPVSRMLAALAEVRAADVTDAARRIRLDTVYFLREPAGTPVAPAAKEVA
jgi:predicted Zn-dependent peptidase